MFYHKNWLESLMLVAVCGNVNNTLPCVAKQQLCAYSSAGKISIYKCMQ